MTSTLSLMEAYQEIRSQSDKNYFDGNYIKIDVTHGFKIQPGISIFVVIYTEICKNHKNQILNRNYIFQS